MSYPDGDALSDLYWLYSKLCEHVPVIDETKETFEDDCGHKIVNVHRREDCNGTCVIHNPTDHHIRSWTLLWRNDRGLFERLCPTHGTGHPDPDHLAGRRERLGKHSTDV